jgi:hypothetical protein
MTKSLLTGLALLVMCATPHLSRAQTQTREQAAQTVAEQWLALVDGAKYPESWDSMAGYFKEAVSKRKWRSTITEIRKPLGKVLSRKLKSAEYSKELSGAPEGEYVVLKFDVVFEKKTSAVETVTTLLGQDLFWRVSGYAVK